MRIVCTLILLAACVQATPAHADEDAAAKMLASKDVLVRSHAPKGTVYVGQKAEVSFDLLTTSFFKGAPQWRLPDVPGAIARQESQFAINGTIPVDGTSYASQTWAIAVYPQRAGTIEIPAIDVVMKVADGSKTIEVPARVPAVSIIVRRPEGALGDVIATDSFDAEAQLEGDTQGLRVGDALRRTITMVIEGAPAMVIPPLPATKIDGVAIYADPPRVDDVMNRGALTGTRIESTSHVFERPGTYTLPAVRMQWFDLESKSLQTIELDAVTVQVAENPDLAPGSAASDVEAGGPSQGDSRGWLGVFVSALLASLFGAYATRRYGEPLKAWMAQRRHARETSEAAFFKRVESACRSNDAPATMNALLAWIDRRAAPNTGSLPRFIDEAHDPELARRVDELESALYGPEGGRAASWRGASLCTAVGRARQAPTAQDLVPSALRLNP